MKGNTDNISAFYLRIFAGISVSWISLDLHTCLPALRTFTPSRHALYLRALHIFFTDLRALFVHAKIVLGWICSPGKLTIFQELLKVLLTAPFLRG